VSPETLQLLQAHDWPGNVRELQSTIKYALVHATGDVLTPDCLPEGFRSAAPSPRAPQTPLDARPIDLAQMVNQMLQTGEMEIYRKVCLAADRVILDAVLRHARGNQAQASELLGISRTTLRAKMRALGMIVEKQLLPEPDPVG
jgi:two-component system nitrogen regulation response regulator GlnG